MFHQTATVQHQTVGQLCSKVVECAVSTNCHCTPSNSVVLSRTAVQ